jgi:hypothetical protein
MRRNKQNRQAERHDLVGCSTELDLDAIKPKSGTCTSARAPPVVPLLHSQLWKDGLEIMMSCFIQLQPLNSGGFKEPGPSLAACRGAASEHLAAKIRLEASSCPAPGPLAGRG